MPARRAQPARSACPRLLPRMAKSVLHRYDWRVDLRPPLLGRRGLANNIAVHILVGTPTLDGAVAPHPAGVSDIGADRSKGTTGRTGRTPIIDFESPAFYRAVRPHSARVDATCTHRNEGTAWRTCWAHCTADWVRVASPAFYRAVTLHPTGVIEPGIDRNEGAGRRRGLAILVEAPAIYRVVRSHPAGMDITGADRSKGAGGWRSLAHKIAVPILVESPALDGAVGPHPAGVSVPCATLR